MRPDSGVEALLVAARAQEEDAVIELLRLYGPSIAAGLQAAGFDRSDPLYEDAQSQALVTIWQQLPSFRGDSSPGTWMYQIAKRSAMSRVLEPELRERKRQQHSAAKMTPFDLIEPCADNEVADRDLLDRILGDLNPRHREILILRIGLQVSTKETAELLYLSEGGVKARLNRAKRAALVALSRYLEDR